MTCTTSPLRSLFFFTHSAATGIYTLSLHDALPIFSLQQPADEAAGLRGEALQVVSEFTPALGFEAELTFEGPLDSVVPEKDRKSTRLNSSHANISYAVFCLKKKKTTHDTK